MLLVVLPFLENYVHHLPGLLNSFTVWPMWLTTESNTRPYLTNSTFLPKESINVRLPTFLLVKGFLTYILRVYTIEFL